MHRHGTVELFRWSLLGLAALGTAGTAVELAMLRHWKSPVQMIPWAALAVLAVSIVLVARGTSARIVKGVRAGAFSAAVVSVVGVVEHALGNYNAGPLDRHYAATWATMSVASRWWAATTGSVGPAPTLAPLVLAQVAVCISLATLRHPSLGRSRSRHSEEERVSDRDSAVH